MNFKIGDMIYHNRFGVLYITEEVVNKPDSLTYRMSGKSRFRAKNLFSEKDEDSVSRILYEDDFTSNRIRHVVDEDITSQLTRLLWTHEFQERLLGTGLSVAPFPEDSMVVLSQDYSGEESIVLYLDQLLLLERVLAEIFG